MFTYNSTATYGFPPSEATNLEYSILSTILGNPTDSASSTPNTQTASQQPPTSTSYSAQQSPNVIGNGNWPAPSFNGASIQPSDTTLTLSSTSTPANGYSPQFPPPPSSTYTTDETASPQTQYTEYGSQSQAVSSSSLANYAGQTTPTALAPAAAIVPSQAIAPARSSSASLIDRTVSTVTTSWAGPTSSSELVLESHNVYKSVTKPYDYTQGYHFLMKHLPTRYVSPSYDVNRCSSTADHVIGSIAILRKMTFCASFALWRSFGHRLLRSRCPCRRKMRYSSKNASSGHWWCVPGCAYLRSDLKK
jgi:hypothetical protein